MKLLYITPKNPHHDPLDLERTKKFEFKNTSSYIAKIIQERIKSIEITHIVELLADNYEITPNQLNQFDLFLCDVTGCNPNVTYSAGMAEALGKPVIYIVCSEATRPACIQKKRHLIYSERSLENEFTEELIKSLKEAVRNPSRFTMAESKNVILPKAFISYSHADKIYLDRLMVHLKPLLKKGLLDIWVDTKIKTGDQWKKQIEKALQESSIAILLISADFLASDFIVDNELPPILTKAEVNGTKILPVIVSPCRFSRESSLSCFQAANNPATPLSLMSPEERERHYDSLASDIEKTVQP